jgi:hypothetical protein
MYRNILVSGDQIKSSLAGVFNVKLSDTIDFEIKKRDYVLKVYKRSNQ